MRDRNREHLHWPRGPGHFRSEEGSEHFFFYNVERRTGRGFVHGWIVGLGIYLMSRLQDNHHAYITDLMNRLALPYQPRDMNLSRDQIEQSLLTLHAQTRADIRWYSIIDARSIDRADAKNLCKDLVF